MLNAHSRVGIAQIVFYAPVVVLATYLFFRRHGKPRMAWYFVFMFSLVRFGSGISVILLENNPSSVGLIIAVIILLGIGVIPLMLAIIGLLRIILKTDFIDKQSFRYAVVISRLAFAAGIVLIVAGGSLTGNYKDTDSVKEGIKLVKAGYIVVSVILAFLIVFQAYLWSHKRILSASSITILKGIACAIPFLVVRVAYAFLSIFRTDSKWNDLDGSIAAFVLMELLMEYIIVIIYVTIGFLIPPIKHKDSEHQSKSKRYKRDWRATHERNMKVFSGWKARFGQRGEAGVGEPSFEERTEYLQEKTAEQV